MESDDLSDSTAREIRGAGLTIPLGRRVVLPGRGKTFVREAGSPSDPTVLLVHGWMASAGLNWPAVFEPLGKQFRVVAPDLRGHGRGIRSRRRFRLEDCADDLAALVDQLGCGRVIVAGYSMGGLVAQLLWRRRPDIVAGLVLCSTTRAFLPGRRERYVASTVLNYGASTIRVSRFARPWSIGPWSRALGLVSPMRLLRRDRPSSLRLWAAAELRRHDMRQVFQAGHASCHFDSREWIGEVDVPTAVVVTLRDRAIPRDAQLQLSGSIENATMYRVDADHTAFAYARFGPVVAAACSDVAKRAELATPPARSRRVRRRAR